MVPTIVVSTVGSMLLLICYVDVRVFSLYASSNVSSISAAYIVHTNGMKVSSIWGLWAENSTKD